MEEDNLPTVICVAVVKVEYIGAIKGLLWPGVCRCDDVYFKHGKPLKDVGDTGVNGMKLVARRGIWSL